MPAASSESPVETNVPRQTLWEATAIATCCVAMSAAMALSSRAGEQAGALLYHAFAFVIPTLAACMAPRRWLLSWFLLATVQVAFMVFQSRDAVELGLALSLGVAIVLALTGAGVALGLKLHDALRRGIPWRP